MSDTPLSITRDDLNVEMGQLAGYTGTVANWSTAQATQIRMVMNAAMRYLFVNPPVEIVGRGFTWSFMRPLLQIVTVADQAIYDLPYDFGSPIGNGTFGTTTSWCPVTFTSDASIRQARTINNSSGKPVRAAISSKRGTGVLGQISTIEFYPTPDGAYTISLRYNLHPLALTADNPYPPGGVMMAEALRKACLRQVEIDIWKGSMTAHTNDFMGVLASAVDADKRRRPNTLGVSVDIDDPESLNVRHGGSIGFTYNGVEYF